MVRLIWTSRNSWLCVEAFKDGKRLGHSSQSYRSGDLQSLNMAFLMLAADYGVNYYKEGK